MSAGIMRLGALAGTAALFVGAHFFPATLLPLAVVAMLLLLRSAGRYNAAGLEIEETESLGIPADEKTLKGMGQAIWMLSWVHVSLSMQKTVDAIKKAFENEKTALQLKIQRLERQVENTKHDPQSEALKAEIKDLKAELDASRTANRYVTRQLEEIKTPPLLQLSTEDRNAEIWRLNTVEKIGYDKLAERFKLSKAAIQKIVGKEKQRREAEAVN